MSGDDWGDCRDDVIDSTESDLSALPPPHRSQHQHGADDIHTGVQWWEAQVHQPTQPASLHRPQDEDSRGSRVGRR